MFSYRIIDPYVTTKFLTFIISYKIFGIINETENEKFFILDKQIKFLHSYSCITFFHTLRSSLVCCTKTSTMISGHWYWRPVWYTLKILMHFTLPIFYNIFLTLNTSRHTYNTISTLFKHFFHIQYTYFNAY